MSRFSLQLARALVWVSILLFAQESTAAIIKFTWKFNQKKKLTAKKGDKLILKWSGTHTVFKFPNRDAFDSCDFKGATQICGTSASQCKITLKKTGKSYYGCSLSGHCSGGGMKLMVVTKA
jgi:hypothetical protein